MAPSTQQRISPDGAYFWDGAAWRPLSSDRRSFWNGAAWRPVEEPSPGPPYPGTAWPAPRPARRWPWVAGAAALVLVLGVCAAAAAGGGSRNAGVRTATRPDRAAAAPACAAPCAGVDGWTVHAANLRYDTSARRSFEVPEAGNVLVTVEVTFTNHTGSERNANPFQFVLRDGAGVKHTVRWIGACPLWSGVNLTAGASYGPKCLAFEAAAGHPAGLVLVWTPNLLGPDHEMPLS
jgi:hypothetical protein